MMKYLFLFCLFSLLILMFPCKLVAQEANEEETTVNAPSTASWFHTYGKVRLGDKLFWDAQTHFRTAGFDGTDYFGRMAQIYNRHGIKYLFSKRFTATVGGVLRLNFSPDPENDAFEDIVLEPRIWHQYVYSMKFEYFKIFHRFRFEHRWSRSNLEGSNYRYRNRYRYKYYMYIPLNDKKLKPGTFYFSPDVELIMQSGRSVKGNFIEDLRFRPKLGYIASPQLQYAFSLMYTLGQTFDDAAVLDSRFILNFNVYYSFDLRKFKKRIPETNVKD